MLNWTPHEILSIPSDDEIAEMEASELVELYTAREEAIRNSNKDPYHYGFKFTHWRKAWGELENKDESLVLGGNRCLAPEQEIYDPIKGLHRAVSEIDEESFVYAWDGDKRVVALAEKPFRKAKQSLYKVTLSNGESFSCSKTHLVMTPEGWLPISLVEVGEYLFSPFAPSPQESNLERTPSEFLLSAARYYYTGGDFRSDYRPSLHLCDAQLPSELDSVQGVSPLQGDVQEHTSSSYVLSDGQATKSEYNHPYSSTCRPSILGVLRRLSALFAGILSRVFCKPCKSTSALPVGQFPSAFSQRFLFESPLPLSDGGLVQSDIQFGCVLPCEENTYYHQVVKIDYLREDYVWDFTVPKYHNYFIGNTIHHNSSKTQFGAYSVVRAAIENPASIIMCFAQSSEVSIRQQQTAVYNWLPPEYRMKQTSSNAYISYTLKNGFTDNSLILPNKSQILFKTYSQYQNNPTFIEGAELGSKSATWLNIGVWLDEYLLGEDLISTLRFRLATRNSKMLVTFTPIDGWTEVIKDYLDKAKTIETKEAELLNGEILPYIQHSQKRNASIHYFHTIDNPFAGYERLANDLRNESREKILIRAYGVPVKSQATKFPKFNKEVNVVPHETMPTKGVTRYHIIDPAGSKNWFMSWIAVDASGTYWVYREWPDTTYGDWAEWKGGKWASGEAAKGLGYGMKDYVDLIHELEGDEEIYERIIDPRLGAAKYQAQDGSSSIIEDLAENDIICNPAPGLDIEDGLQALISKMSWDTSKPMDSLNRPKFYVSEECGNCISALSEYTGEQGLKEAWKDPLDTLRYAAISDIAHVESSSLQITRQGSGGY
jgi:hypothetical protein